jgi:hypothetical protein
MWGFTANNGVPAAAGSRVTGRYRRRPAIAPVTVTDRHRRLLPPPVTVTTVTGYVLVTASPRQMKHRSNPKQNKYCCLFED